MDDSQELEMSSLEAQLVCLYADRERLETELGTADAEPILKHIRSLEEKLRDLESEAREVAGEPESDDFELRLAEVVTERESFFEELGVSSFSEALQRVTEAELSAKRAAEAAADAMAETVMAPREQSRQPEPTSPALDPATAVRLRVDSVEELVERFDELEQKLVEERSHPTPAAAVPAERGGDAGRAAAEVRAFVDALGGMPNAKVRFDGELSSGRWSFSAGSEG